MQAGAVQVGVLPQVSVTQKATRNLPSPFHPATFALITSVYSSSWGTNLLLYLQYNNNAFIAL